MDPRSYSDFPQFQDSSPAILAPLRNPIITNEPHHHLPPQAHQHHAARPIEPEEELESHDSFLEYIDGMLMDESFEDSSWLQLLFANANGGKVKQTSDGLGDISSKNLSASSSLNDRYQHIFEGFHEILDGQSSRLDHSPSFPWFINTGSASYGIGEEVSWTDRNPEILEGLPELHAQEDTDGAIFMRNLSPAYMTEVDQQATAISSPMGHDTANLENQQNVLSEKSEHIEQPYIMEVLSNGYNNGRAVGAGAGHFHTHARSVRSSELGHTPKVAEEEDISLVRNPDLPTELYAQLFDEWPEPARKAATCSGTRAGTVRPKKGSKKVAALADLIDLKGLLLSSSKAAGEGNTKRAKEMVHEVQQQGVSPYGSGLQRVVHYFCEALVARLNGTGSTLYKAMASTTQLPSPRMMVQTYKMVIQACPYVKIGYLFANQYILKVAGGASRLHIVDCGILYGFQWPCLIYALAHRREGPPSVRITGIEFPANPADINPTATTEGTSRRLAEYAKAYNVPFEYHAISSSNWEDIDPASLNICQDEVLVVNSFNRLGHLHDESVVCPSPRDQLLQRMRSLNPRLLVVGCVNATHSSPFFAPRFREAFHYYHNMFDMLDTTLLSDSPERVMFERELMGRAILNVVACEGRDRTEIPANYKQWEARIKEAGFQQLPDISSVMSTAKAIMKYYHKDFSLLHDSNEWMLLGWRGRCMQALSAWEPV